MLELVLALGEESAFHYSTSIYIMFMITLNLACRPRAPGRHPAAPTPTAAAAAAAAAGRLLAPIKISGGLRGGAGCCSGCLGPPTSTRHCTSPGRAPRYVWRGTAQTLGWVK